MIELRKVKKSYHMGAQEFVAIHGVDLLIKQGELVAMIGASGSGKSTIMNIIGLLDQPSSGHYFLNQESVADLTRDQRARLRNQSIGFVFQSFFLLPRMTALQNVGLPLLYRGVDNKKIKERSLEMLEKVGMVRHLKHKPAELSGGQQQRVAIARALIGQPKLILADEPTGALDSKTSQEVLELLIHLNREEGATVLIISHDMKVAEQCDRTIKIKDGVIEDSK